MTPPRQRATVVPLSYEPGPAATALGMAESFFREHVAPEVKAVRRGKKVLYPVTELQAWLDKNAKATLRGAP